jgi:hypothetical protein
VSTVAAVWAIGAGALVVALALVSIGRGLPEVDFHAIDRTTGKPVPVPVPVAWALLLLTIAAWPFAVVAIACGWRPEID